MHDSVLRAGGWLKRWVVFVLTSEKFIQSVLSGAAFAIINKSLGMFSVGINSGIEPILHHTLPEQAISLPAIVIVFGAAFWADQHQQWFRNWVEEETGVDAVDDTTQESK